MSRKYRALTYPEPYGPLRPVVETFTFTSNIMTKVFVVVLVPLRNFYINVKMYLIQGEGHTWRVRENFAGIKGEKLVRPAQLPFIVYG